MIFKSINQLNHLLIFFIAGIFVGVIHFIYSVVFLKNYGKLYKNIAIFTIFYIFFIVFFEILLFLINFGKFAITLFTSYCSGFFLLKILTQNLLVIFETKWYNVINKIFKRPKIKDEQS